MIMIIELEDMYGNTIFAFKFDESDVENMRDFEECYDYVDLEFIDVREDYFWDSDDDMITVRANKRILIDDEELDE